MITLIDMETPPNDKRKPGRPKGRSKDRHKPGRQVRIRAAFLDALDGLARANGTTAPEEVNRAVRELLQREGRWPRKPPPQPDQADE